MAADDDLDELEAQLDDYDDEDDDDLPPIKRIWKKYKLFIIPGAAFLVFIPIILISSGGSDKGRPKVVVIPELAPEPGKQIKMVPEAPGGAPGDKPKEVFNVMAEGDNAGKVVIEAPPEEPKKPEDVAKAGDAAPITLAPEGAEKTPKEIKTADGAILPPPVAPEAAGELSSKDLPVPGAPAPAGSAESILPPPDAGKPAEVTMEKVPKEAAPAESAPKEGNQLTVLIPKGEGEQATVVQKAAPPSAPADTTKATPLRTMSGVYRVQVASARSEAAAKTLWDKHVSKYPDLLGKLPLTVQPAVVQDRGTFYRVQGGAFNDRESADSVCRKLKSRGLDCLVVRP